MSPWMLQGLAAGCLLTAALAVVQKEHSKSGTTGRSVDGKSLFARSGTPFSESHPDRLPSKTRGLRKDESYAGRMKAAAVGSAHVGGQVNQPGRIALRASATLGSVIEKAGGPTPFGAANRVRLTRGSTVTEYNLKTPEGRSVKVLDGDCVEVPQKSVMGR